MEASSRDPKLKPAAATVIQMGTNPGKLEFKLKNVHPPNPFVASKAPSSTRIRFPSSLSYGDRSEQTTSSL